MIYDAMKKKIAIMLLLSVSCSALQAALNLKNNISHLSTVLIPINDAHPLRYNFHKYPEITDECECTFDASVSYRFSQSFNDCTTASLLFQSNTLNFQGAAFEPAFLNAPPSRSPNSFIAEYFGLGKDTNGAITLDPQISNNVIDFKFNFGFDRWANGLYLQVGVPVENSHYSMNICSQSGTIGTNFFKGFMTNEYIPGTDPISSFGEAPFSSLTPASSFVQALSGYTVGDLKQRSYGLFNVNNTIACSPQSKTCNQNSSSKWGVADITLELGWDACKRDISHVGVYLRGIIPTGTKIDSNWSNYVFSPVIGNSHHYELGAGINAHVDLWACDDATISLVADGYLTHMFSTGQLRYFDLVGKPLSRYALAKTYVSDSDSSPVYQNALYSVADITAQCVDVSVPVKGEFILEIAWKHSYWKAELGYGFSGQQAETLTSCVALTTSKNYLFGLMGLSGVQAPDASNPNLAGTAWTNSFISPSATAFTSADVSLLTMIPASDSFPVLGVPVTKENVLKVNDIDVFSGLMAAQVVHRVFGSWEYTWHDSCWSPSLGFMGSVGFSPVEYYTPQMWDIGVRLGASY